MLTPRTPSISRNVKLGRSKAVVSEQVALPQAIRISQSISLASAFLAITTHASSALEAPQLLALSQPLDSVEYSQGTGNTKDKLSPKIRTTFADQLTATNPAEDVSHLGVATVPPMHAIRATLPIQRSWVKNCTAFQNGDAIAHSSKASSQSQPENQLFNLSAVDPTDSPPQPLCSPSSLAQQMKATMLDPAAGDGFGGGGSASSLIAYWRQLGCSPEAIHQGVNQAFELVVQQQQQQQPSSTMNPSPSPLSSDQGASAGRQGASLSTTHAQSARASNIAKPFAAPPDQWSPIAASDNPDSSKALVSESGPRLQMDLERGGLIGVAGDLSKVLPAWVYAAEALAAGAMAFFVYCWQSRPTGWVATSLVHVQQSPVSGKGLFAKMAIAKGTCIGAYPGRLRTGAEVAVKAQMAPATTQYVFRTRNGQYLDPTDNQGMPSEWPSPGMLWPVPTDPSLAFANEPPKGSGGTNCFVEDGERSGKPGTEEEKVTGTMLFCLWPARTFQQVQRSTSTMGQHMTEVDTNLRDSEARHEIEDTF